MQNTNRKDRIAGVLKRYNPDLKVVAVEPENSPVLSGGAVFLCACDYQGVAAIRQSAPLPAFAVFGLPNSRKR